MIERILPATVIAVEAFSDPPVSLLFPEAEAVVARAVETRRREFSTARHCARQAMTALGVPPAPILPGRRGAPRWPDGVVGSITHTTGYRAAAVSRHVSTIGIDAEPHRALPDGVVTSLISDHEQEAIARLGGDMHWGRLAFSAKESLFKAWLPLTRRWLDFQDAVVTFDRNGTFRADLTVPHRTVEARQLTHVRGRWMVAAELACTAVVVDV